MRAGDVVRHEPTGETWVLAWADGRHVCPCGWPVTMALACQCVLLEAATNKQYRDMLRVWAGGEESDPRTRRCRRLLEEVTA
jgi:hypothetical protein